MAQRRQFSGAFKAEAAGTTERLPLFCCILGVLAILADARAQDYYIDPANGSDSNDGNASAPWKSFRNAISYYQPDYRPAGWIELKPGDCIYLMNGSYSEMLHPGEWNKGPTGGGSFVAYFRGRQADKDNPFRIRAYPGHKPIIDPKGQGFGLSVFQSGGWEVEGIEVANAYGRGISLNESKEIKVHNVHIHDTDGVDNNNIAGLYITDCWNGGTNTAMTQALWKWIRCLPMLRMATLDPGRALPVPIWAGTPVMASLETPGLNFLRLDAKNI